MTEELSIQEQLKWVKYRIQLLNMIEDKLREMKDLVEIVKNDQPEKDEIMRIQARLNELINEIVMK